MFVKKERRLFDNIKVPFKIQYPMKVFCSYCDKFLYWSESSKPGNISHGICDDCQEKHFPTIKPSAKKGDVFNTS